jgi:malate dehydrogenase (quinone)
MTKNNLPYETDVLIIGSGIMGTTLASIINEVNDDLKVTIVEKLDKSGLESSHAFNNAGTGHAGYCEVNYTPILSNNKININKALKINSDFETSLQYWAYLARKYRSFNPKYFIKNTPHISLVSGDQNIAYLKKRYMALKKTIFFRQMEYTNNFKKIVNWIPLLGSNPTQKKYVATRVKNGTDVNFGEITKQLIAILNTKKYFNLYKNCEAKNIYQNKDKTWTVNLGDKKTIIANFIFIASGGGALTLLQKTGIPEQKGYSGFPVNGQWLICEDPKIVAMHESKVYGKAEIGSPPMSMPHLDLRIIDGKKIIMFGPFASFTFKFLISGSFFDLVRSIKLHNLKTLFIIFFKEWALLKYLIKQNFKTHNDRLKDLREFYPEADGKDWYLRDAGIRVQIIKRTKKEGAKIEFGTEIIFSSDKSLAALLGASPGASISVHSMINIIERCFLNKKNSRQWKAKIRHMIPSYGLDLARNSGLLKKIRANNEKILGLNS